MQPLSWVVFLSWSSDLLRDSLSSDPVDELVVRLGIILGLGALAFWGGIRLIERMVDRIRRSGEVGFT